jgi:hypothetical protein
MAETTIVPGYSLIRNGTVFGGHIILGSPPANTKVRVNYATKDRTPDKNFLESSLRYEGAC